MTRDAPRPRRRSIRLKGHDYAAGGAYFITICTNSRRCVLGDITAGTMSLNDAGSLVGACWEAIPHHFPGVLLDASVVMPNHIHGVLILSAPQRRGAACRAPTATSATFGPPVAGALSTIVRSFKAAATKRINELRGSPGMPLWQRNYYEHIIRNKQELTAIRQYILDNPARWSEDEYNPGRPPPS